MTIAQPRRRISSRSPVISRASISSVTPGRLPIRTPASLAALRAAVWEIDWIVGARTTSAAAIAAATARRRLGGGRFALGHHRQGRVGAVALRLDPHQRADLFGHRVADHQHLLARRDAHALADHRPHRPIQLRAHALTLALQSAFPCNPPSTKIPDATSSECLNRRRAGAAAPSPRTRPARPGSTPKAMNGGSHPPGCVETPAPPTTKRVDEQQESHQHRPHRRPPRACRPPPDRSPFTIPVPAGVAQLVRAAES